ncbi:MAG TPA: DNA polymerase IV [Patescibacteria group bacterium]|nr:DNA polymerase IV [Patescibacteria group bacterium]
MTLFSWPRAIMHVDGDAFFASCEQAANPKLRGKPVVTGAERGIVTAASYEAKAKGVMRGVPLSKVRKLCPDVIFVDSDYALYSDMAEKMFSIMRRYTPYVEEYSIDEAFADLTGFDQPWHATYEQIARRIKEVIEKELEITVSVGLSLSKGLAKIGSKFRKPSGFTPIPVERMDEVLQKTPIEKVWGIGPATASACYRLGLRTAFDFANAEEEDITREFTQPIYDIWCELRGESVHPVNTNPKTSYASISKFETFRPPTADRSLLFSRLVKNLENACAKARRYYLIAPRVAILLRCKDMHTDGLEIVLPRASAFPPEIASNLQTGFEKLYRPGWVYRATGVVLFQLRPEGARQQSLFESPVRWEKWKRVYAAIDQVNAKLGHYTVHLAETTTVRRKEDRDARSSKNLRATKETHYANFHFDPF